MGTETWADNELVFGEFLVRRRVGSGAYGVVYMVDSHLTGSTFASKRLHADVLGLEQSARENFMSELRTWMDLPDHPHLLPCLFFRTSEDWFAIFSEFAHDGSLEDQIGSADPLQLLEAAIHMARALASLRGVGLVHRDVKPSNVLRLGDTYKLADFGISTIAADAKGGSPGARAYHSPEQARAGGVVGPESDVYSLAATLLHLFLRDRPWGDGANSDRLQRLLKDAVASGRVPVPVGPIMEACLRSAPSSRPTPDDLEAALASAYQALSGAPFVSRVEPSATGRPGRGLNRSPAPLGWFLHGDVPVGLGPDLWLFKARHALAKLGRRAHEDALEAMAYPDGATTAPGEVAAALRRYDEAVRLYRGLVPDHPEYREALASVLRELGGVYASAGDVGSALRTFNEALELAKGIDGADGLVALLITAAVGALHALPGGGLPLTELESILENIRNPIVRGLALRAQASGLARMGDGHRALECYGRAIEELEAPQTPYAAFELANALDEKAQLLHRGRDLAAARTSVERAIKVWEALDEPEFVDPHIAMGLRNHGIILGELGDLDAAVRSYDSAIAKLARIAEGKHSDDIEDQLASCYMSKGITLSSFGRGHEARKAMARSIAIRERLVMSGGRHDYAGTLARAYSNLANSFSNDGPDSRRETLEIRQKAYGLLSKLVGEQGHAELTSELGIVMLGLARDLHYFGDDTAAAELYGPATGIFHHLINDPRLPHPVRARHAAELVRALNESAELKFERADEKTSRALRDMAREVAAAWGGTRLDETGGDGQRREHLARAFLAVREKDYAAAERACDAAIAKCTRPDGSFVDSHTAAEALALRGALRTNRGHPGGQTDSMLSLRAFDAAAKEGASLDWDRVADTLVYVLGKLDPADVSGRLAFLESAGSLVDPLAIEPHVRTCFGQYVHLRETHVALLDECGRTTDAKKLARALDRRFAEVMELSGSREVSAAHGEFQRRFTSLLR